MHLGSAAAIAATRKPRRKRPFFVCADGCSTPQYAPAYRTSAEARAAANEWNAKHPTCPVTVFRWKD